MIDLLAVAAIQKVQHCVHDEEKDEEGGWVDEYVILPLSYVSPQGGSEARLCVPCTKW